MKALARFLALLALAIVTGALAAGRPNPATFGTDQVIVRLKPDSGFRAPGRGADLAAQLRAASGENVTYRRTMAEGHKVIRLSGRRPLAAVEAIARALARHPDVLEAFPDRIVFPAATPGDTLYAGSQWALTSGEGINAAAAWDITKGSDQQVIAVVDTGVLPHADLDPLVKLLPGYDFVSDGDKPRANDGDGRDADPTDPGDWVTSDESLSTLLGCPVVSSTWHGTAVAGIIAAATDNAAGIAGINWNARLLPVRALGKCGGYVSDVADAILWSIGISVPGIPDNANRADVINLSLSIPDPIACDSALASAINFAVGQNIPVVVAAGDQAGSASAYSPANCPGVIAVGAVLRNGGKTSYGNTGSPIALSAPGGDVGDSTIGVVAPSDSGTTTALNDNAYRSYYGSSIAAAHVTGVVSLMQAVKPTLGPADIKEILRNTVRAFPAVGTPCTTLLCGDGIVNAQAAVQAAASVGAVVPHIAAANNYSAGVRSDGTLWSWGVNQGGQFGTGSTSSAPQTTPIKAPGLSGITINSAGPNYALGLRADAVVLSWGSDGSSTGKLGRTSDLLNPGIISGLDSVTRLAAGNSHSVVQKVDGTVWTFGRNDTGQLGIGGSSTFKTSVPLQVTAVAGAIRTLAGSAHTISLKSDGTVWAWGSNSSKQLGNASAGSTSNVPVQVTGITTAVDIATSSDANHSLALLADHTVVAWGDNANGQLGNNTQTTPSAPVAVQNLTDVVAIATGGSHSLALKSDGTVMGWGFNSSGQLGDGTTTSPRTVPVNTLVVTDAVGIAAGLNHSLALNSDGSLYAWGANSGGQLSQAESGTPSLRQTTPVLAKASAGSSFSLDLAQAEFLAQASAPIGGTRESNTITAAQGGTISIAGDGNPQYRIGNAAYTNADGSVTAGQFVTAKLTAANACNTTSVATVTINGVPHAFSVTTVACDSTPDPFVFATQASLAPGSTATSNAIIVNGINEGAAISVTGGQYGVNCSGYTSGAGTVNDGAQICVQQTASASNDASTAATLTIGGVSATFFAITAPDTNFAGTQLVRAGSSFSVGQRSDGTVYVWGRGSEGQLGNASLVNASLAPVQASISGVTRLGAGSGHLLALRPADGTVWTWGANGFGQLGLGTTVNRTTPARVPGLSGISRVSGGFFHSAALRQSDGTVWAWGYNNYGQLGDNSTTNRFSPVQVSGLTGMTRIVAGNNHTLALDSSGHVWAWGDNTYGQLGDGTNTRRLTPVQVTLPGGVVITEIAAGAHANHALALDSNGNVWAWGRNNQGQVGDNTTTDRSTPIQVASGVSQVAVGEFHSLALKTDATVYAWGWGANGRLGDGTTNDHHVPTLVQNLPFAAMIAAGGSHSMAVRPDGTVVAWGYNFNGQLGDGTTTQRLLPTVVQGGALNLDSNAAFFSPQVDVPFNDERTSNMIRITGIVDGSVIAVANGKYRINAGAFTDQPGVINDRDQVTLSQFSAPNCGITTTATVTVAGAPRGGGFSVTTHPCDTAPDPFGFNSQADLPLSALATSNTITPTGINAAAQISISAGNEAAYSIGCIEGNFTSNVGTLNPGDTVCVRHRTANAITTQVTTTLTIGGVAGTFTTTTAGMQTLTVSLGLTGSANGSVTSISPSAAINCPSTCAADFNPGQVVTLAATPDASSLFTGWSGDCTGTGTCTVTLNSATFVVANFIPGPVLQSVKSRKTHGAAGPFDLVLDHTAPIGSALTVEPRAASANTHKIVFLFDVTISDPGSASCVDALSVPVGSVSAVAVGSTVEVTLTGVPDNKRVLVSLTGVNGGRNVSTAVGFSSGDVDGTRAVTASDILRAKGRVGQTTDGTNFLHDIDLSGTVAAPDLAAVQANVGSGI